MRDEAGFTAVSQGSRAAPFRVELHSQIRLYTGVFGQFLTHGSAAIILVAMR